MEGIHFDPVKHVYTNSNGEKYISGTQFIGLFKKPFDKDFWQKYKAVERLLTEQGKQDVWKHVKTSYLKTEDKQLFYELAYNEVDIDLVTNLQKVIANEWKTKSDNSLEKGSKYHDGEEAKLRKKYNLTHDWNWLDISYPNLQPGIYPELRLYNHKHKIAGSADKVNIYKEGKVKILDYKTSEKIEFQSWTNPWTKNQNKMLYVCSELDDCNGSHYTLQLSLYGWMMEQLGYKVKKLIIKHIAIKGNKPVGSNIYPVEYMKNTIEAMIDYYNTELKSKM